MLTIRTAEKLVNIGDVVFVVEDGNIRDAAVRAIEPLGIDTDVDFLPFDEHGISWYLTICEAFKSSRAG